MAVLVAKIPLEALKLLAYRAHCNETLLDDPIVLFYRHTGFSPSPDARDAQLAVSM